MSAETKQRLAPYLFILLSATCWLLAGVVVPYADPLTFSALRFEFAAMGVALLAYAAAAAHPRNLRQLGHMLLSGILIHAFYVGGIWWAIAQGLSLAVSATIIALQPLCFLLAGHFLGESTSQRQWAGIATGAAALGLIASLHLLGHDGLFLPVLVTVLSLGSVTLGVIHRKFYLQEADRRTLIAYQHIGALLFLFPAAWLFEPMYFELQAITTLALVWAVGAISIGAILLSLFIARNGGPKSYQLPYFILPPVVSVLAFALFGEVPSFGEILAILLCCAGGYLAQPTRFFGI